jgi:hypothetical protein
MIPYLAAIARRRRRIINSKPSPEFHRRPEPESANKTAKKIMATSASSVQRLREALRRTQERPIQSQCSALQAQRRRRLVRGGRPEFLQLQGRARRCARMNANRQPVVIDQSRVAYGLLFATHGDRCRYRFVALQGQNHMPLPQDPSTARILEEIRLFLKTLCCHCDKRKVGGQRGPWRSAAEPTSGSRRAGECQLMA